MIRALLSTVLLFGIIILLLIVAAAVVAALVLGLGWGLSLVFPVSIMEAAIVILCVAGGVIFYAGVNVAASALADAWREGGALADVDWWEDEEDREEEPPPPPPTWRRPPIQLPTVAPRAASAEKQTRPDDLCPCGSGRKYKNCCGKKKR